MSIETAARLWVRFHVLELLARNPAHADLYRALMRQCEQIAPLPDGFMATRGPIAVLSAAA